MCTRGVWQLEKLVFRYCEHGGSSQGMREWMRTNLKEFTQENPQIRCEAVKKPNRHPIIIAQYKKGDPVQTCVKNMDPKEITKHVMRLRNQARGISGSFSQQIYTKKASIQGLWRDDMILNPPQVEEIHL